MGLYHEFEGMRTNIPGIYIKQRFPPAMDNQGAATGVTVIMGECNGGVPYNAPGSVLERLNYTESGADALEWLEGGPAYYCTEFFLTPHKDENFGKPGSAITCRVNQATQATGAITSGGTPLIHLTAVQYGTTGNHISRKIAAGTESGKYVEISFKGKPIIKKDNVGAAYVEIHYIGTGTAATVSITPSRLTTTVTGVATDDLSIAFNEYPTVNHIVSFIDEQPNYTCSLKGNSDTLSDTFDIVTAVDILTAPVVLRGDVAALIQVLNSCAVCTAELAPTATRTPIDNDPYCVFLTGGSSSPATVTDWKDALKLLEEVELNHIVVASGDPVIHAMVDAHCQAMSGMEIKKYRRAGAGAASTTTNKQDRIDEMKALNSSRFDYCVTPFIRLDAITGKKREFAPFYGHAMVAGYHSANHVTFDPVFNYVNILGVAEKHEKNDKNQYIDAGATLFIEEDGTFSIAAERTTYQGSNTILLTPCIMDTVDFISKDIILKTKLQLKELHQSPDEVALAKIQDWLSKELFPSYQKEQKVITKDSKTGTPAFSNVSFTQTGNKIEVKARLVVVTPIRFGFFTLDFVVPGQT